MAVRPWLTSCTAASSTSTNDSIIFPKRAAPPQETHQMNFDSPSTSSSDSQSTSPSDTTSTNSLQSNLSLQTLPSVPSLQKLAPSYPLDIPKISSHHLLCSFRTHRNSPITSLSLNHNLLYSSSGNQIHVWNLTSLSLINSFNNSGDGAVKSLAFSDGKFLTAHQDCKIRIWKTKPQSNCYRLITSLPTVNDRLRRFPFPKNYVRIRRHSKRLWIEHADTVSSIAVSHGFLYSVSWDKSLKIWRISDLRCIESVNNAHEDAINAVCVSGDGTVFTGSADNRIRVWGRRMDGDKKQKKHSLIATLEKHKSAVNALALSSDGSVLYSGACDRSILVWEREDSANHMTVTGALRGHGRAILCLVNVSDFLFSGSADRTVGIWRKGGGDHRYTCLAVLKGHERPVKSLVARRDESSGGFAVCSGSLDGEIKVWQVSVANPTESPSLEFLGSKL